MVAFAFHEATHRNARPAADDLSDLLLGDLLAQQPTRALLVLESGLFGFEALGELGQPSVAELACGVEVVVAFGAVGLDPDLFDLFAQRLDSADGLALGLPLGVHGVGLAALVGELTAQLLQPLLRRRVALLVERRFLDLETSHPAGYLVEFARHRVDLGAQHRARLVDEVDGLVGKEPVGDVAIAQCGRSDERTVEDLDAVEHLEPFSDAPQNRQGVLDGGFVDDHGLEAAFQRRVLLDVFAVFVEGGGADHVELAAGEHRLEHVARVHGALARAGPDDGVQFVDEEQDLALGCLDLAEHRLQTFLELTAVLGAGNERSHVELEQCLVSETVGHVAAHDAVGESFDDGGLADTGFADEDRIVLRLARQDLDDPTDLGVATDDGVELAAAGVHGQITAVLLQRLVGRFGRCGPDPLVPADLAECTQEPIGRDPEPGEEIRCRAVVEQREHEMFHRHVVVLEATRLGIGGLEQVAQALGDEHLTR